MRGRVTRASVRRLRSDRQSDRERGRESECEAATLVPMRLRKIEQEWDHITRARHASRRAKWKCHLVDDDDDDDLYWYTIL